MKNLFKKPAHLKIIILIIILFVNKGAVAQKNCNNHTTNLVPIMDLVGKQYRGYLGGKYSTGNVRPSLQLSRAIYQAQQIKPLDSSGMENYSTGKIIFAAVGASNPATEFNKLIEYCDTFKKINKKVRLFNTCIGGTGIQKMNETTDNYWIQADKKFKDSGYSVKQVQVVWVEQENTQNPDTAFPSAPLGLLADYKKLLEVIYLKFPNVKIVYINQRAFAGYADVTPGAIGKGLHFPRDYYNGWCIKWLIEKQINNEVGYKFPSELPFIDWATSFWADGKNTRSDGLSYDCVTDFGGDGLHFSELGERKAGAILFNYFKTDTASKYWFYEQSVSANVINTLEKGQIKIYPNPAKTNLNIESENECQISCYTLYGQQIFKSNLFQKNHFLDVSLWPKGIILVHIVDSKGQLITKKISIY